MDSTVASPLLRKSDSSSVRSGFCKLYTFLNVLIFQDVVIFTFVEDMKFFPNCWFLWKISASSRYVMNTLFSNRKISVVRN